MSRNSLLGAGTMSNVAMGFESITTYSVNKHSTMLPNWPINWPIQKEKNTCHSIAFDEHNKKNNRKVEN